MSQFKNTRTKNTQRDFRKEFQINPLTALLPNEGSIDVLAKYLENFSEHYEGLNQTLKEDKLTEQDKNKLLAEKEMLSCVLGWAGLIPRSNNFLSADIEDSSDEILDTREIDSNE